ncbi:hypothetical protein GWI33_001999 [Rhynchophorus ferrugineus]|uniref:Uncharacterized protein n=1 Tax=Rhynchophorus ferrugineus TaxID=354439 RepID=A0A834IRJ3_RHYFE|nr:hypothetical protein GWI33_001999 [Rhynchophorus ferrugineus]
MGAFSVRAANRLTGARDVINPTGVEKKTKLAAFDFVVVLSLTEMRLLLELDECPLSLLGHRQRRGAAVRGARARDGYFRSVIVGSLWGPVAGLGGCPDPPRR